MNDKIKTKNQVAKTKYFDLITHMSKFKAGSRDDPSRDEKGKEIKKIQAPITNHEIISCKYCQNKPDTCQFWCKYKGKQYKFGDCPICHCSCKFLCTVIDFVKLKLQKLRKQWQELKQLWVWQSSKPLICWIVDHMQEFWLRGVWSIITHNNWMKGESVSETIFWMLWWIKVLWLTLCIFWTIHQLLQQKSISAVYST